MHTYGLKANALTHEKVHRERINHILITKQN